MLSRLLTVTLGAAALGVVIGVMPGLSADSAWAVLAAAVVLGVLGAVLRPLLVLLCARGGWLAVVAGWLVTQALLVYTALALTPGMHVDGFWPAFWAAWLGAVLTSVVLWFATAGQPGAATRHLLRANRRYRRRVTHTGDPGVLIVQIDGLSAPLARWAIDAGNLPTLGRWLRSGSHTLSEWHAQLPPTTPASQAGILHGAGDQIPAFRWYEKETGRLVVTNRPRDSALVEQRCSDGKGLLAGGGVSVSNVFSGDAELSLLTMSTAGTNRPDRAVAAYLLDPFGLTRSLVLTTGEMVKELVQARRQRVREVRPRMRRRGSYVLLRGVTNVLLRHLNLAVLAEQLMRGAPAVYCDFVDYDEIAHHAGPARPESLASLEGIDSVLATLEQIARAAPRPYRLVVLSDHGQSLGSTFAQRYGLPLEDLVRQLAATGDVLAPPGNEQEGRAQVIEAELVRSVPAETGPERPEIVVAASGNLALIYLARLPGRVTMEEIERRHPRLLSGLTAHPGIGFVLVRSRREGAVVLGPGGRRRLRDDHVDGLDPLASFGPYAADDLRRHDRLAHTGDLVVNSLYEPGTGEVAAFEELIGCHGGLGGDQSRALLVLPREWGRPGELIGADAVHRLLLSSMRDEPDGPAARPA